MAVKISKLPLVKRFYLLEPDPDGESYVEFRQARKGEQDKRDTLVNDMTWMFDETGGFGGLKQNKSRQEIHRLEVYTTLCGSNLEFDNGEEKDTEPVFKFKEDRGIPRLAMSEIEFTKAWDVLPPDLAEEILKYCHEHNPQWSQGES